MSVQPFYCHRCCLGNIKPSCDEWSQNLISRFKGITMDAELQMKVSIIEGLSPALTEMTYIRNHSLKKWSIIHFKAYFMPFSCFSKCAMC